MIEGILKLYGDDMKKFILPSLMFVILLSGCGRIRHKNVEQNYSGFPRHHESHNQFSNTSLLRFILSLS